MNPVRDINEWLRDASIATNVGVTMLTTFVVLTGVYLILGDPFGESLIRSITLAIPVALAYGASLYLQK